METLSVIAAWWGAVVATAVAILKYQQWQAERQDKERARAHSTPRARVTFGLRQDRNGVFVYAKVENSGRVAFRLPKVTLELVPSGILSRSQRTLAVPNDDAEAHCRYFFELEVFEVASEIRPRGSHMYMLSPDRLGNAARYVDLGHVASFHCELDGEPLCQTEPTESDRIRGLLQSMRDTSVGVVSPDSLNSVR